jgi:hypothetical protein
VAAAYAAVPGTECSGNILPRVHLHMRISDMFRPCGRRIVAMSSEHAIGELGALASGQFESVHVEIDIRPGLRRILCILVAAFLELSS